MAQSDIKEIARRVAENLRPNPAAVNDLARRIVYLVREPGSHEQKTAEVERLLRGEKP